MVLTVRSTLLLFFLLLFVTDALHALYVSIIIIIIHECTVLESQLLNTYQHITGP